jgi:hypothetical protein
VRIAASIFRRRRLHRSSYSPNPSRFLLTKIRGW